MNQVSVNTKGAIRPGDEKFPFAFLGIFSDKWNSIFRNLARYTEIFEISDFPFQLSFHSEFSEC